MILFRGVQYENGNQMAKSLGCSRGAIYKALKRGYFFGSPIIDLKEGD